MAKVGTPKTPRLAASSVPRLSASLTSGWAMASSASAMASRSVSPCHSSSRERSRPSAHMASKTARMSAGSAPWATASRSGRSGFERMRRRHAKGDVVPRRVPVAPAIGMHALGRNLRRSLVLPMAQQPGEENRAIGDLQVRRQPVELDELQIGEGREKIEVPVGGPHRPVPHVRTSGSPADCARFRLSARGGARAGLKEMAEEQ